MTEKSENQRPKILPAIPFPIKRDPAERVAFLRRCMDPEDEFYYHPEQHANIKGAIKAYQEGKLVGMVSAWFVNGQLLEKMPTGFSGWAWLEVCHTSPYPKKVVN